ncbi:glycolipid transfer protein, putative [Plasmodium vivax]|uniref:Glycolipid transfer protein, putative n=6 Tax=Plasmodium vivax TaxID=5855 RepID=A5K6M6_PLAVS|nr:glycolipid transfer protein, putative [Plasmodium vivax]KMZ81422.1 glycolipid transfer protein [Plasmodium vivax India VII]KMZ87370.1 glycolipid transfer protein [Plasmodium vivax Brazil I]KMZ93964.1 glycolipid transfer protein [Plasmodium vivax Mauritania I]KNA00360.1 glycolipid transfer protein [Plasmodium vivax North Korean]EDL44967.1 glycolipid transfer protein, putative [Plasmodium vivax]|eukprot:XP_001614694.1 glycolipid transfer protein [Plasmodium vivax Sal-1]
MSDETSGISLIKNIEKKSLECREGNEIVVLKLCELCNCIHPIYKKIFGDGFIANLLIKDLKNSTSKVQKAVEKIPEEVKYVSTMYSHNLKKYPNLQKLKNDTDNGIVDFLWMKRTIEFIVIFLEKCYVTNCTSKLNVCARDAYDQVLKAYHGFATGKVVTLALKLSPSREALTERLQFESNEQAKAHLQGCLSIAKLLISDISKTIEQSGCNFEDKV